MPPPFLDRRQAGQWLARALEPLAGRSDVRVLGLAHDGVPVACEVANALGVPWEVLVVERVVLPVGPPRREVTLGLLAFPPAVELHEASLNALAVPDDTLRRVLGQARRRLGRQVKAMRPPGPPPELSGCTAVVVDDRAVVGRILARAAGLLRRMGARRVVAALPVGTHEALRLLATEYDEVVCPCPTASFISLPSWYEQAPPVSNAEVRALLGQQPRPRDDSAHTSRC